MSRSRRYYPIQRYVKDALNHDILRKDQEVAIGKRILKGDEHAVNELVEHNLRFVVSLAKSMKWTGLLLEDIVEEGNIGLITAAKRFDYRKNIRFISYAVFWIMVEIRKAYWVAGKAVKIGIATGQHYKKAKELSEEYENNLNKEITVEELAEGLEVSMSIALQVKIMLESDVSLDESFFKDGKPKSRADMLESNLPDTDELAMISSEKRHLERLMSVLSDRERDVLSMRFGLPPYEEEYLLREVGKKHGVTRERVRQIQEEAIKKINDSIYINELSEEFAETLGEYTGEIKITKLKAKRPYMKKNAYANNQEMGMML